MNIEKFCEKYGLGKVISINKIIRRSNAQNV